MSIPECLFTAVEGIDKDYSPMQWSHRLGPNEVLLEYFEKTTKSSALAKETIPCELGISYSNTEAQKVDILGAKSLPEDAPIFAFVHGGYWLAGSRDGSSGFSIPLYKAQIASVVFGYDLISEKIRIPDIVAEIRQGIAFVLDYAIKRKSRGVYLCGHSAGAHLVAMALSSMSLDGNQKSIIKGIICVSGLYDLDPLRQCLINEELKITEKIASESSPMKSVDKIASNLSSSTKILVVVAEHDSPAFKKQSEMYEQALKAKGLNSEYSLVMDEDHFTIIEKLAEDDFLFSKRIIELVGRK